MKRGLLAPFEDLRLPVAAADLIVDYLTWPGRSAEVDRRAQRQCDLEGSKSLRERFDGQDRADARQADHRRKPPEPLVKYILDKRQEWPKEDVETSLVVLWNEVAQFGIWGWIGALVQLLGLRIEFESREPVVGLDCCEAWLRVTSRIDPDALLCYALARMGLADQVQALDRWGTSVRIADADLSMMLGEGVADLHVHLGGIRSALIAWQKLVLGDLRLEQLPRYAPHELQRLAGDPTLGRYRHEEKARLQWILELVHEGTSGLYFGANVRRRRGAGALADTGRFQRTFLYERRMMSRLFARGMPNFRRRSDSNGRDDLSDALLDFYVFAKSSFIEAHQQPIVTNPGLAAFRSYFRGTLPVGRDTSIKPLRWTPSAKLQAATQFADLAAYITQSRPLLKKLELRIGPLGTLSEYAQFFTAWRAVEKEFKLDAHGLEIRFAVHFKRSADRRKSRHTRSVPDLVGLQRELDAQAFTLHMLRRHSCSNPRCKLKESAARIARIDLAGQERDAPPDIAAFQMRLLRGDVDALDKLAEPGACDELAHKHWLLLDARKQAGLPVGVPRLRATCHAGEDFAHPLEGIYCMDIARESLKLGPGDTIGHGLAAGWNVEAFDRERTPRAVIREGSLFDSLLWLRCEIGRWPSQLFAHLLPNLDAELRNLFIELYQEMGELPSLTTLGKLFQERAQPIPPNRCFCIPAERMRGMEVWNRACIERRARHVALPVKLLHELRPAITYAQAEVAKKLAEQGIALELNPSSNLRVSGALTLDELPFLQLLRRFGSFMLATLNTDNPGTFSTRIENEYALVTAALRATGVSRAETMEIVERLRRIGMYAMPWGHDPANREPGESCASAESSSLRGG